MKLINSHSVSYPLTYQSRPRLAEMCLHKMLAAPNGGPRKRCLCSICSDTEYGRKYQGILNPLYIRNISCNLLSNVVVKRSPSDNMILEYSAVIRKHT